MRLIDADRENGRLLDFIAEHDVEIQNALEHKDRTLLEDIFNEYFNEQSTAYDVDKVVEQLEDESEIYCREYGKEDELYLQGAIEIVKGGGVE